MEFRLPEISGSDTEAVITEWLVGENGDISPDQDIVEVATDKATFSIPSPCEGVLRKIRKNTGDTVKAHEVIAEIEEKKN